MRRQLGALIHEMPRYLRYARHGTWQFLRNRNEQITTDGRGVQCQWEFTSELHIANVFPKTGERLMRIAREDWPIELTDRPSEANPKVSFIIGHRGKARYPHLLATLKSIAAQKGVPIECIVVEQSNAREIEVPDWVRLIHTPLPRPDLEYCRSWAFNVAAKAARGEILILHDNDMLVPESYAAEVAKRSEDFIDLKRFIFYLREEDTQRFFADSQLRNVPSTVIQNLQGGSIAARRDAYLAIGGFDEAFIGWGGEDNDFWERAAAAGRVYPFGYLPIVHLFHAAQPGKLLGREAPAVKRYYEEVRNVPPKERIARLLARGMGRFEGPTV